MRDYHIMCDSVLCHICATKATVFITLIKNSQATSVTLCQHHAETSGVLNPKAYGLVGAKEPADKPLSRLVVCNNCGFTHHDFNRLGRFGCSDCYKVFAADLKPILKQIQLGMMHTGKTPRKSLDLKSLNSRLSELSIELNEALKLEHFEDAAHARDEIERLKHGFHQL